MNIKFSRLGIFAFLLLSVTFVNNIFSQTQGTFTFNITTTSTGGYTPKHLVAIWIENNSAAFIKTKLLQSSVDNLDHLAIWTGKSLSDLVDATSGATLTAHGALTVIWNGTNVSGAVVPDGTYNVWVEMAWAASLTTGKTSVSFPFTKGSSTFHSAPASTANFSNITLDWVPSSTLVKTISAPQITVYPNPTNKLVTINFKQSIPACTIQILNAKGKEVYSKYEKSILGSKTLDLSKLADGVYFVNVLYGNKNLSYRVVKRK